MMENSKNEYLVKIEEAIKELPNKAQNAIYWIITHFEFVEEMCKNPEMTNEEIEEYKEEAKAKEDYIMLALLCAAQTYKENSNETTEQEN
ncbi:hypothetical protein [Ruminiclostridium cellobioparum]|uniref:hypothetical protein n=1 Tax=Ruminiclostridium cellobioparum TaxID=29355 RepID=UPI000484E53A|nr:hypothetical protein [Ruminiclostridium cellobioparum]